LLSLVHTGNKPTTNRSNGVWATVSVTIVAVFVDYSRQCGRGFSQLLSGRMLVVGTGYISFDEFCAIVKKKIEDDDYERELKEMFRALDTERRGEVNTKELR